MSKEAMKLALARLQARTDTADLDAIAALNEALAAQPAPSELTTISEDEWLLDVDESAWRRLVEKRGGCRCHLSPPCAACSEPVTEAELNDVGYTYEQPAQQEPVFTYDQVKAHIQAAMMSATPVQDVSWGVDWGKAGDVPCVCIIKRLADGRIEVVAVEYGPTPPSWIEVQQVKWEGDKLLAKLKEKNT